MAKKNPLDNLKPYKPGQSGNPSGKPGLPKEVLKAKATNRASLEKTLNEFLMLDRADLQKRLQDPKATMLELAVGTIVAKAAKDGDQIRLNFILDRLLGKVKDQVAVEVSHKPTIIQKLSGDTVILGTEQVLLDESD